MTPLTRWRTSLPTALTLVFGVLAACSGPDSRLAGPYRDLGPSLWVGGPAEPGAVQVCNYGPAGSYGFTVQSQDGSGTFPLGASFTLTEDECQVVWRTTSTAPTNVRVTETGIPTGVKSDSIVGYKTEIATPQVTYVAPTLNFDFRLNSAHSGSARFYNSSTNPLPPPSRITVCKNGPPGTYSFTADAVRGTLLLGTSFTLDAGECKDVWEATAPVADPDPLFSVHVTEVDLPFPIGLDSIIADTTSPGKGLVVVTIPTIEFEVNYWHGGAVTFYNSAAPPPPQQRVTVCKVGPVGTYNFTVSQTAPGGNPGNLPLGGSFTLGAGACADVWTSNPPTTKIDPEVSVVVTEVGIPALIQFDSLVVDPLYGSFPFTQSGPSVTFSVNALHGGYVTYYNSLIPPPPCAGLTPGFWKNWRNQYTAAQMTTLLQGTIASTVQQADAIFNKFPKTSSDPVTKLRWFVLANQLTLNLTALNEAGANLPNPSAGNLIGTCTATTGGSQLGGTLAIALRIIADPAAYTSAYILSIKDILDAIANLGGG